MPQMSEAVVVLFTAIATCCFAHRVARAADRPDVVFADFEGPTYRDWKTEGTAFGDRPAEGTLANQMPVTGFKGRRLVNSFHGGDESTGTLTSPAFTIARQYVSFLIGGGGYAGTTCINLLVDDQVVRTATGPNTQPGGSEELAPAAWDVADLEGRTARIQIVDHATGGWGHINVDQIVFTDAKPIADEMHAKKQMLADKKLLCLPVKNGARFRKVVVSVDGKTAREFQIEAADGEPDWWASVDVSPWQGQTLNVDVDRLPGDSRFLSSLELSDQPKGQEDLYREPLRQQFHFSAARGWLNDPNGLCYYNGEYHLFFQACPYTTRDSDKHWGHAVSTDLIHWKELGIALYPDVLGPMWSGSAVVDWKNTSGFGINGKPPLVLAYTAAGAFVQCLACSNDGRTFTKYEKNPVVANISGGNRDPKVIWYEPTHQWVMCVYVGFPADGKNGAQRERNTVQFLTSPDLKKWTKTGEIDGFFECPDLFPLPVDGNANNVKWVLTAANSDYMVGQFDGQTFKPETRKLRGNYGSGFYAAQTFSDIPASDGRRIQIGWLQVPAPGMSFNQAMSVPLELKLISTPDGPRLTRWPVKELDSLRENPMAERLAKLPPIRHPSSDSRLWDIRVDFKPIDRTRDGVKLDPALEEFAVRGITVRYDAGRQELSVTDGKALHITAPAPLVRGRQRLEILADVSCFEIFASDGLVYIPLASVPPGDKQTEARPASMTGIRGSILISFYDADYLKPMWQVDR